MRYLVVIDHTLGGTGLTWAVREHALEEGDIQVDVIVPAEESETDTAQGRLDMELQRLGAEGIAANGSVVQTDPYDAICDAAGRQHYDGIIIATHPRPFHDGCTMIFPGEWNGNSRYRSNG